MNANISIPFVTIPFVTWSAAPKSPSTPQPIERTLDVRQVLRNSIKRRIFRRELLQNAVGDDVNQEGDQNR
jgi:hypothetical protein